MALSKPTSAVRLPSLAHAIAKMKGAPPPADPNAGITAQAQAEIDPVLKAVTERVNAKAQAGMGAISGYSQQLASQLGGYQQKAQDIYSGAQQSQAATDAALSNRLTGGGTELADQLASRLAGINAPAATGAAAASVTQNGAGAGNALYGKGSASQSALIAQGAGAQDYAAKLPGIAALGGLQAGKELQLKSASDLADKTAQVETQLPTIINQIRGQQQNASQYAQTRADRLAAQQQSHVDKVAGQKSLDAYRSASLGASGARLKESQLEHDRNYQLGLDRLGISEENLKLRAAQLDARLASGGITPTQTRALAKNAGKIASQAWNGKTAYQTQTITDENGKPVTDSSGVPRTRKVQGTTHLTYQEAMREGLAQGIPLAIMQKALNTFWSKPGQTAGWEKNGEGRPKQPFQQRQAGKAGAVAEPTAYVTVAPTANRPGAPLSQSVVSFVGRIGKAAGEKLTIGTGTNHNEYVAGSNRVSDHWGGDAADVPASGAELTRLGRIALVQAGMPVAQAMKQTGGLFNVNGYQVIFNSMEGGNHFNHLHVGVRRTV